MILKKKLIAAFTAGTISLVALVNFQSFTNNYFSHRQSIYDQINTIEASEKDLDTAVLQSGFFLYVNQDEIVRKIDAIEEKISDLEAMPHFTTQHPKTAESLHQYKLAFERKASVIYDFQTANSAIKNATMAIPVLKMRSLDAFSSKKGEEHLFLEEITKASGSVLLAKNSLDGDFLNNLELLIQQVDSHHFQQKDQQAIVVSLSRNLKVFREFFPLYKIAIEDFHNSDTFALVESVRKNFGEETSHEMENVDHFSYLLVFLYISSLGLIIYFLIRSEIEAVTDRLTGLGNRKGYETALSGSTPSTLFLININKFKNYNDFYGIESGDRLLQEMAQRLRNLCDRCADARLYRLGGDEFGILSTELEPSSVEGVVQRIFETIQNEPFRINDISVSLSISVAVSNHHPLLETADMALKSIKKDYTRNFILYHKGLDLYDTIRSNILKTQHIRDALQNDRVFPYFQPIVSLQSGETHKYEALARMMTENGEVQSIVSYLDVLKESKYYPNLTRSMIQKSIYGMESLPYSFSINLSIEDMTDSDTVAMIHELLQQHPQIAPRIIFEILESEAVNDYNQIATFIQNVKHYGCQIAIDDFGSGYSNFAHILNLDIDILKIDASLIREIHLNPNALMIVKTIVGFAKEAGIQTVAEYVSEEAIYQIVRSLGIDYAQGYYIGKPEPLF